MEITRDVVEMWCDADARNEMLRRNPDSLTLPTDKSGGFSGR